MRQHIGKPGSVARRRAERRAILEAYFDMALGAALARIESGWLPEEHSPLGTRRHIEVVRRRLAQGEGDAAIVAGQYMLTIDAIADEMFRVPSRRVQAVRHSLAAIASAPAQNDNAARSR